MSSQFKSVVAAFGLLLLLPSVFGLYYVLSSTVELIGMFASVKASSQGDPKLFAGLLSANLIKQLLFACLYLPGIVVLSFVVLGLKYCASWFRSALLFFAIVLLLTFPIVSVLGFYTLWLFGRARSNAY